MPVVNGFTTEIKMPPASRFEACRGQYVMFGMLYVCVVSDIQSKGLGSQYSCGFQGDGGDNRAKSEHVYFINGMLVLLLNHITH